MSFLPALPLAVGSVGFMVAGTVHEAVFEELHVLFGSEHGLDVGKEFGAVVATLGVALLTCLATAFGLLAARTLDGFQLFLLSVGKVETLERIYTAFTGFCFSVDAACGVVVCGTDGLLLFWAMEGRAMNERARMAALKIFFFMFLMLLCVLFNVVLLSVTLDKTLSAV